MNKNIVANIVLAVAVVVLYILHFTSGSTKKDVSSAKQTAEIIDSSQTEETVASVTENTDSLLHDSIKVVDAGDLNTANLPNVNIAYVNIDVLNQNYKYLDQLEKAFTKDAQAKQKSLQSKAQQMQEDYKMFMEQVQSGMIDQQKAVQMDQSFKEQQMALMQEEQQMSMDLQMKQQDFHNAILEKISKYLNKYAQDFDYDYILAYGRESGVLYAKKKLDITDKVLKGLNSEL